MIYDRITPLQYFRDFFTTFAQKDGLELFPRMCLLSLSLSLSLALSLFVYQSSYLSYSSIYPSIYQTCASLSLAHSSPLYILISDTPPLPQHPALVETIPDPAKREELTKLYNKLVSKIKESQHRHSLATASSKSPEGGLLSQSAGESGGSKPGSISEDG